MIGYALIMCYIAIKIRDFNIITLENIATFANSRNS